MKQLDKLSKWLRGAVNGEAKPAAVAPSVQAGVNKSGPKPALDRGPRPPHGGSSRPQNPAPRPALKKAPIQVQRGVMRNIPVGGLEEVGKNCMIVEHEDDIVVIDMGFQFPEEDMLGIDYVIPDIQYLVERKQRIKGILITHGHLDHIGALPYTLPDLGFPPIYGSKLSLGLVKKQLEEHKMVKQVKMIETNNVDTYTFGSLEVKFFRVNHSIPDSLGMMIRSPQGTMVHTGDFKFDFTPADGIESDIGKMAQFGREGVDMLFSDSTNATKPGHTISERVVGANLERAIADVEGRIIIACFASLIGRIQQIIDYAERHNRKVFLAGGSMVRNSEIAQELGFLKIPKGMVMDVSTVNRYEDKDVLILTTGSQGEPMAALSRMAGGSHAQVKIKPGDTVVVSASPILGNEKSVADLMDNLARLGAQLVHNRIMDVHTSGHGQQEDLKMMMSLIKPKHFVPIHGNYFMRQAHAELAPHVGIPMGNVHMMDNGNVIEIRNGEVAFRKEDIGVRFTVVDGLGRGDVGSLVLKDRSALSENGVVNVVLKVNSGRLIGKPLITTRGFVYQKEEDRMEREIDKAVQQGLAKFAQRQQAQQGKSGQDLAGFLKGEISGRIVQILNRRPVVLVTIVQ
jgi:ribonuclease J